MPLFIGDYLADTMHLSTEQHGAYLLLLFHLWRRGKLPDDNGTLARITGLSTSAWMHTRAELALFFDVHDGLWHHGRVERERERIAARQESLSTKGKKGAQERWKKTAADASGIAPAISSGIAGAFGSGMAGAMRGDAISESKSESESESKSHAEPDPDSQAEADSYQPSYAEPYFPPASVAVTTPVFASRKIVREKRAVDPRHMPFRKMLAGYWRSMNHASPDMPWQGRDASALHELLRAIPSLNADQFQHMLENRARSAVAHGDRVYLWIGNITRFQEAITIYNKPASAGGGNASRAEINRDSVVSSVDQALVLFRELADRPGQAGVEPATVTDTRSVAAYGAGPGRRAVGLPGVGDHGLAAGDAGHGAAGTDGPVPHRAPVAVAG